MARFPTPLSHEKGLPQPVSASGSKRPRRRRYVMIGMLAFMTYVLYCSMQKGDNRVKHVLPESVRKVTQNSGLHIPASAVPSKADVDAASNRAADKLALEKAAVAQKAAAKDSVNAAKAAKANKASPHTHPHGAQTQPHPAAGGNVGVDPAYLNPPIDALPVKQPKLHGVDAMKPKVGHVTPALAPAAAAGAAVAPATTENHSEPSKSDRVLLLLSAVKDKTYTFPSDALHWMEDWQATSQKAFAGMLNRVRGASTDDDAKLYLDSHVAWLAKHRKASPLTIFSKSYCPYSKRAKALLKQLGVEFDVYEVDLRSDAVALQRSIREVSGHSTFPAIFLGDRLIGGSDDLASLSSSGKLHDVLQGGGVTFKPETNPLQEAVAKAHA